MDAGYNNKLEKTFSVTLVQHWPYNLIADDKQVEGGGFTGKNYVLLRELRELTMTPEIIN